MPLGSAAPTGLVDLRIAGDRIAAVGPSLERLPGEDELDAAGRWLIPGLWDEHTHLGQWARQGTRLDLAGSATRDEALARVRAGLGATGEVLVGGGFRPSSWAEAPTTSALDEVSADRPIVLVSGDAHSGWLNSAALRRFGLPPRDGLLREAEWFDLLPTVLAAEDAQVGPSAYAAAMRAAAARGVVGIVDYEFEPGFARWPQRYRQVGVGLRIRTSSYPVDVEQAIAAGLRTGEVIDGEPLLTMGALKIISDGSLNTQTAHCREPYANGAHGVQNVPAPELTRLLGRAKECGLEIALHAIGDAALQIALDAFATTGASGSIEHAQLAGPEQVADIARLGLIASVQPAHLLDDRGVTEVIWDEARAARSFPLRELAAAGVELALGSDAPVAPLDPWLAMAAGVHRGEPEDAPWHPEHSLTTAQVLAASTDGHGAPIAGDPADLVLLEADPLADGDSASVAERLRRMPVAATMVAGQLVHQAW